MAPAVTRVLLIECGAAQTRAAFVENDIVTHFWFGPAPGDEALDDAARAGERFAGRIASRSPALSAAFVDIGAERAGFLPLRKKDKAPVEGERRIFIVRRPAIGAKGPVLSTDWRGGLGAEAIAAFEAAAAGKNVGRLDAPGGAVIEALAACGPDARTLETIIRVNDNAAKRALESHGAPTVTLTEAPFAAYDVDALIDDCLTPYAALPGGARLLFQESEAGVMVDLDTGGAGEGGGARLNDKSNLAAADRLLLELSRRALGGRVIVDFLPPSDNAARKALSDRLEAGLAKFSQARFGRLAKDGLCDFTVARRRRSLLDQASEPAGDGFLRAGRRLTLDWSAKSAIGALERTLAGAPSSAPRLVVGQEIGAYLINARPQWSARLAARYGARFTIETSASTGDKERSYDVIEQARR